MSVPEWEFHDYDAVAMFLEKPGLPFFQVLLEDGVVTAHHIRHGPPIGPDVIRFDPEAETIAFQLSGVKTEELAIFEFFKGCCSVEAFGQMADCLNVVSRFHVVWAVSNREGDLEL